MYIHTFLFSNHPDKQIGQEDEISDCRVRELDKTRRCSLKCACLINSARSAFQTGLCLCVFMSLCRCVSVSLSSVCVFMLLCRAPMHWKIHTQSYAHVTHSYTRLQAHFLSHTRTCTHTHAHTHTHSYHHTHNGAIQHGSGASNKRHRSKPCKPSGILCSWARLPRHSLPRSCQTCVCV